MERRDTQELTLEIATVQVDVGTASDAEVLQFPRISKESKAKGVMTANQVQV